MLTSAWEDVMKGIVKESMFGNLATTKSTATNNMKFTKHHREINEAPTFSLKGAQGLMDNGRDGGGGGKEG